MFQQNEKPNIIGIELIEDSEIKQDLFYKYINSNKPVVFSKYASKWDAITKWTPEYLINIVGYDHIVDVNKCSFGGFYRDIVKMKFSEYITKSVNNEFLNIDSNGNKIIKTNNPYLRNFELFDDFPILNQDIEGAGNLFKKEIHNVIVKRSFIGCANSATHFHIDTGDNLVTVIKGCKYILLIPPTDQLKIDYEKSRDFEISYNELDYNDINSYKIESHPAYSKIPIIYSTLLKSGQSLFIPKGWMHYIHNIEYTISVICMGKSLFE